MVRFNLSTIKNNKGFTLAEALVAVTIILVGIISIVTLAVTLTKASKLQQGKVVALNLAKEGLEVSKNIRDTNWLSNNNFFEGFQNSNFVVPVFNYDDRYVGQDTWFLDSINRNTKIYQDDDGIMFQEDGIIPPSETIFNRELEIKYIYQTDLATETVDPVFHIQLCRVAMY